MEKLPNFVMMMSSSGSGTGLRLIVREGRRNLYGYYRDGGDWSCGYEEQNGELYSSSHVPTINGFKLVPTTEEEWRISNGRYAPTKFKKYGTDTVSFGSNPCVEIEMPTEIKNNYKYLLIRR